MADVEQWDRLGYASGDMEQGMQDAILSSIQPGDMCKSAHKHYFSVAEVVENRRKVFVSACNKGKIR